MPNAAYEVLFSTNASKVEQEIKRLHRQVDDPIIPTVDLKQLKALNAELDLKQRHLKQTIAYFRQNAIAPKFEMSMGQLSPAEVKKALPSSAMVQAGKEAGKTFAKALKGSVESSVIDADIKLLESVKTENIRKQLTDVIKLTNTTKEKLMDIARLASKKGIEFPGVSKQEIKTGFKNVNLDELRQSMMTGMKEAAEDSLHGFVRSLTSGHAAVGAAAAAVGEVAIKMLRNQIRAKSPSKETEEAGKDFTQGLVIGIKSYTAKATQEARNLAKETLSAMKDEYQIHSPAFTTFIQAKNLVMGQVKGLKAFTGAAVKAARELGQDVLGGLKDSMTDGATELGGIMQYIRKELLDTGKYAGKGAKSFAKESIQDAQNFAAIVGKSMPVEAIGQAAQSIQESFAKAFSFVKKDAQDTANVIRMEMRNAQASVENARPARSRLSALPSGAALALGQMPQQLPNLPSETPLASYVLEYDEEGNAIEEVIGLYDRLAEARRLANGQFIDTGEFENAQRAVGVIMGQLERAENIARREQLLGSAGLFANNSLTALSKELQALQIEASEITPRTSEWNALQQEIAQIEVEMQRAAKAAKLISLGVNIRQLPQGSMSQIAATIQNYSELAADIPIGNIDFRRINRQMGVAMGLQERGQMLANAEQLRGSASYFEGGSSQRLTKNLQALQVLASQIKPNTLEWERFQAGISKLTYRLSESARQAQIINLTNLEKTFPEKSLDRLNASLEKAKASLVGLVPNSNEWFNLQRTIGQTEAKIENIARLTQRINLRQKEIALPRGSIAQLEASLQRKTQALSMTRPDTSTFTILQKSIRKTENDLDRLRQKLRVTERLGAAAGSVLYGGGLAGSPLSALTGVVGGFMGGIPGSFTGAAIGQTADQAIAAAKAITDYAASISKLRIALAGVSSGLQGYRANLSAVNDISNKFALSPDKVIMPYTRLQASVKAAGYDVSVTKNAFEAILAASIATGGGIDDLDGSLRALTQVFAKGTVQSEELVGQLSERIPGAFAKFAQANKMSTSELKDALAAGRVGLEEMIKFLDKLKADYAKSAATIAQSEEYAGQRMTKALDDLRANVGNALVPIGAAFQDWATGIINQTNKVIDFLKKLGVLSGAPTASQLLTQLGEGTLTPNQLKQQIADLEAKKGVPGFKASAVNLVAGSFGSKEYKDTVQSIAEKLFGDKDNEALKGRLGTLKTALMQYLELEKNQQTENAATLYEDQIKKAKSYSEKYYSLIQARDEQLADARESHEKRLQDIRLSQARELSDYIAKLDEDRRQTELDTLRERRSIALGRLDEQDLIALSEARSRGEDTSALEAKQRINKRIREDEEQLTQKKENFEQTNRKRQEEIEKMRKRNAEEINKANRENAETVAKIQLKFSRDSKKIFADAAVEFGRNMSQSAAIIGKEAAITLVMYHRVFQGLHPRKDGNILDPVIERLEKQLNDLRKGVFGSPPSKPATTDKGQGGPDLPDSKLPEAGPTPVGAMPVPGRDKLPPDYFLGTDANGTRQVNPKHITPYSEQINEPSSSVPIAIERTTAAQKESTAASKDTKTQEQSKQRREELLQARQEVDAFVKSSKDALQIDQRKLDLLRNGINPALIDELVSMERTYDKAIDISQALKENTSELQNAKAALQETLAIQKDSAAVYALELDYRKQIQELAPPGIEKAKADLRARYSISDESVLNREAKRILDLESLTKISGGITSLGETMNSTLGNAIVNAATDWKNFSGNIQDTVKSIQDAFKQLANTIIQELTRAYANKAVSWLMGMFGFPAASTNAGSANVNPISNAWQTGFGSNAIGDIGQYLLPSATQSSALSDWKTGFTSEALSDWKTGFTSDLGIKMIPRLADGGIAKAPTLGMIGEGRFNEAIIPMPNNRAVPVQLRGDMGGNYATSIAVTVNNSSDGGAQSQMTGDQGNRLAGVLDRAVKDAILSEQRPGGLLYRQ